MSLLINTPLSIKGVELSIEDLMKATNYYKKACLQEYIFENADDIDEDTALKIADIVIDAQMDCNYSENDLINMAKKDLGYKYSAS